MPLIARSGGMAKRIKDATAVPSDVLSGKVFYNNQGRQIGKASLSNFKTVVISKNNKIPLTKIGTVDISGVSRNEDNFYYTESNDKFASFTGIIGPEYDRFPYSWSLFTGKNTIPFSWSTCFDTESNGKKVMNGAFITATDGYGGGLGWTLGDLDVCETISTYASRISGIYRGEDYKNKVIFDLAYGGNGYFYLNTTDADRGNASFAEHVTYLSVTYINF